MEGGLGRRMALMTITVAVGAIILTGIMVNYAIGRRFDSYVHSNRVARDERVAQGVRAMYAKYGSWPEVAARMGEVASISRINVRILDARGNPVFSSSFTHSGREGGHAGLSTVNRLPLRLDGKGIGTLLISGQGGGLGSWTGQDREFKRMVNLTVIIAGIIAAAGALFAGTGLARRLSLPMSELASAAEAYGSGRFDRRVRVSASDELGRLGRTFNSMAEQLERMQYLRRKQTADVSHELRTPLAILQGHVEAMQDGVLPCSGETLASVHEEVLRLGNMVSDLMELSVLEERGTPLAMAPLDIAGLVSGSVDSMKPIMVGKGLAVTVDAPGEPLMVNGNPEALERVMRNLLSNAVKYTDTGGRLLVAVADEGGSAVVRVTDTGIGIPPEERPFVFERFHRADGSRTRETGGAGIGLALVKELLAAHSGTVGLEDGDGPGSTFVVRLPLA